MTANAFLNELASAIREYRFDDIPLLLARIRPIEFTDKQATKVLRLLRSRRLFDDMERTAGLFYIAGKRAPEIRRQHAQALLDLDRINQGLDALGLLAMEVEEDPIEGPKVRGLMGRAYKQLFVNEGDPNNLVKAIHAYRQGWAERVKGHRWHGINLAALLARAEREGVDPGVSDRASDVAHAILKEIDAKSEKGVWDYATAMQASLPLGLESETLKLAKGFATHPDADAFELGATIRQLREIWNLDQTELGRKLLPVLEYELLQREGGTLEITAPRVEDTGGFESVYGQEAYVFLEWMDTMYEHTRSVARVFDAATGERWGTGFVVGGAELCKEWGEELVFVTNAHVISENPADRAPMRPEDGTAEFTRLPDRPRVRFGELLFSSPKEELDVSILRLVAPLEVASLRTSFYRPTVSKQNEQPQRIFVMGHPKGAELAISLYDNTLVGYSDPYVHYRSPTEGGSSGSPVFNRKWQVFALHHRAKDELQANEGVLLERIREAASRKKK